MINSPLQDISSGMQMDLCASLFHNVTQRAHMVTSFHRWFHCSFGFENPVQVTLLEYLISSQ